MKNHIDRRTMLKKVGLAAGSVAVIGSVSTPANAAQKTAFDADSFKALQSMDLGGKNVVSSASYYGTWQEPNGEVPSGGATYYRDGLSLPPSYEYTDRSGFSDVNGVGYRLAKTGMVSVSQFGARTSPLNEHKYADDNTTAIQRAIDYLATTGGTVLFDAGYYYINGRINVPHSGIKLQGMCSPVGGDNGPRTYLATTNPDLDIMVIANNSSAGVSGIEICDLVFEGAKELGGTNGNCLTFQTQYLMSSIAYVKISNCVFTNAAKHGLLMTTATDSFIFNCRLENVQFTKNKMDGCRLDGLVSQFQMDQIFADGNGRHGLVLQGTADVPLKNVLINRLTLGIVSKSSTSLTNAGLYAAHVDMLDIHNILTESIFDNNIELRSVSGVNFIGGAIQQLKAGSGGIYIGTDGVHPNKNITIDIPGWTRIPEAQNYIHIEENIIVDGLYLGRTADNNLAGGDITNFDKNFYKGRIKFLYEDANRTLPVVANPDGANARNGNIERFDAAGSGAYGVAAALSTNTKGRIELTHGTGAWTSGAQFRVYFATATSATVPFDTPPVVMLQAESETAALHNIENGVSVVVSNEYFDIVFAKPLTSQPSGKAKWAYRVIQ